LFSIQIFAVALYVFAPYARRVASALVTDRSVPPTSVMAPFNTPRLNNAARALGLLVVAYSLGSSLADSWQDYRADHSRETADLAGVYDVGSYVTRGQDNATRQPTPWVQLIIERFGIATVRLRGDTTESYHVLHQPNTDSLQMTGAFDIRVVGPSDTTSHARFTYSRPNESELLLYGVVNDDSVTVRLRRVDTSKFRLMSQPFHWVQGRPGPSAY
jgi:hypothetical protein